MEKELQEYFYKTYPLLFSNKGEPSIKTFGMSFCSTIEEAEDELLKRYEEIKSLNKKDFSSLNRYLSEIARIDNEIMMLEMTVDERCQDWSPTGSNHCDFKIGTIFRSSDGRWLCTDVGRRTVIAIRYTPQTPENMDGPPYFLSEHVFDELDLQGVDILK